MRQRGGVFVLTLATLAGLVAILVGAAAAQRTHIRSVANQMETDRAAMVAESGVARVMAAIAQDTTPEVTSQDDEWYTLGNLGTESYQVGNATFRVEILDLCSRLNLNSLTQPQLELLPLTTEQIESLLDWREATQTPRPQGAKDDYYNNLTEPYNTALRNFETFDELLLVRGFTPDVLFEVQENVASTATVVQGGQDDQYPLADIVSVGSISSQTDATGQAKLNVNSQTITIAQIQQRGIPGPVAAQIFARRGSFATIGAVLALTPQRNAQVAILDNLAIDARTAVPGLINLNTAPEPVLNALPGMTPDVASAIVARQSSGGFTNLSEMLDIPGLTGQVLQSVAGFFTVKSNAFLVRIAASSGGTTIYREALITVTNGQPKLMRITTPPFSDMIARWAWDPSTSSTVTLLEEGQ